MTKFVMNSSQLRKQIEDNESRLYSVSCTLPTSEDLHYNGILENSLINDKPTVEPVVHEEQTYTKTSLGDAQESRKSEQVFRIHSLSCFNGVTSRSLGVKLSAAIFMDCAMRC